MSDESPESLRHQAGDDRGYSHGTRCVSGSAAQSLRRRDHAQLYAKEKIEGKGKGLLHLHELLDASGVASRFTTLA